MRLIASLAFALALTSSALAADCYPNAAGTQANCGAVIMYNNPSGQSVPATAAAPLPTTGTATLAPSADATAGVAPVSVNSAANGLVLKSGAGNLYSLGVKIGATTGYVLLIDATAIPSNGAVTSKWCKPVLSNGTLGGDDWQFNPPLVFSTGITALFSTNSDCTQFTGSATAQFSGQPK